MSSRALTAAAAATLILLISAAHAWNIEKVKYNTSSDELTIEYSFSPFEFLYAFFIGGGEYTKAITHEIVFGNYTIIEAGYSNVRITLQGNITFSHPVNIYIEKENESYYLVNVTSFVPE